MGNLTAVNNYAWGDVQDDGSRCVHSIAPEAGLTGMKHVPREFNVIGVLQNGVECDLSSLEALACTEPKGLLLPLEEKRDDVLAVCRLLEEQERISGYEQVGSLTNGEGIVLTFTKLLEVGTYVC